MMQDHFGENWHSIYLYNISNMEKKNGQQKQQKHNK